MFKFDFEVDDIDTEIDSFLKQTDESCSEKNVQRPSVSDGGESDSIKEPVGALVELTMEHLLNTLPLQISYSPLEIPLSSSSGPYHLARRDLFDARFQVISEDQDSSSGFADVASNKERLRFLDTPSDLVPGVYEGGLKTWECSLDLVDYLDSNLEEKDLRGKRVLELGCGTGVPSLYLLQKMFSSPSTSSKTEMCLQDYNPSTLELVTFPNVLLAWYMSPASISFRNSQSSSDPEAEDAVEYPLLDPTTTGDLPITSVLKDAFVRSLKEYGLELRFFGGSWKSFKHDSTRFDIVLTSETIYRTESVPELIDVMWNATHRRSSSISEHLSKVTISEPAAPLILVAAKVFYFGVGGGVDEFVGAVRKWVENHQGSRYEHDVKTVWEKNDGVGRRIVRVVW
ncbi:hypothetical protein BDP27DRAFT_1319385 [Rhodocollybia butyracea]|uniref:protein-histidine N-methyltransferase n=1 Tax=Rhodocollybia butyracea TaxID=206335 RepID=A0A9P5UBH9_9AGAR|nr:hypothetical protein BDP27DRAFT_1319385 [Rhodocollybia butyracea]